ncbi:hypothetical protein JIN87_27965 [Pelagicoccus mobilis]|uniref:Porin domain-containing protein n=4 Tax=Pelagicoccus mobilis TaxID=415221 RepID=A0A934S1Q1_9BACT|nr:hypothetical protein [Pelagicoccus mobilis]
MGWETAEPTGLYQYSYAYGTTIPGYHNGVTIDFSEEWGALGLAVLDSVYDDDGSINNDADDYDMGIEAKVVLTPADGLTFFLGYAIDSANGALEDRELINFWTSYEVGASTFAFEYNDYSDTMEEIDQWLAMYSVGVGDKGTFTARISSQDGLYEDFDKYTAAYIHAVNDNLALVTEVSQVEFDMGGDSTELALEALFTF